MDFIPFNTQGKETTSQSAKKASQKPAQKTPAFGSPAVGFGSPAVGFGAPAPGSNAPKQTYGTPTQGYGTSVKGYGTPTQGYGTPAIGFKNTSWQSTSPVSQIVTSTPTHNQRSSSPLKTQFTPRGGYNNSPHGGYNNSPRGQYPSRSPQHQTSYNPSFTPSPLAGRNNSSDGSNLKPPHHFSPGRGRGSVKKSYSGGYFPKSSARKDPNLNSGGSMNIEDYYSPCMLQDPWKFLKPVPVNR